jgi:hypothetical protein
MIFFCMKGLVSDTVRPHVEEVPVRNMDLEDNKVRLESKEFTYLQLVNITNNFTQVIGQGGFGTVYYGYLEGSIEVAVKLLSGWPSQGMKEFVAEVTDLNIVRHLFLRNEMALAQCDDEVLKQISIYS